MAGKSKKRAGAKVGKTDERRTPKLEPTQSRQSIRNGVLLPAMCSAFGLWLAFPPLGWAVLAWIAPIGWLLIVERELPVGRRGYVALWLSGCLFWLLILQGVRLAFWPLYFGWLALSLYLAVYVPLFVGAARILRWGWRLPLVVAAPIAWVGMEMLRGYLLTGFAANTLAHSQAYFPLVIQLADQLGSGGISFVMMSVAAAVVQSFRGLQANRKTADWAIPVGWATLLVGATLGYGWWRLAEADRLYAERPKLMQVMLVQENTPTMFEINERRNQQAWTSYLNLTRSGAREYGTADLVVWPESTFTANEPWFEQRLSGGLPADLVREQVDRVRLLEFVDEMQQRYAYKTQLVLSAARGEDLLEPMDESIDRTKPHLLLGSDAIIYNSDRVERYNAAMFIGPDGEMIDHYDKMHLVMFGEYIPLGPLLQWLRDAVGLPGIDAGREPKCFQVGDAGVSPSICFESMVPRLLSWQVRTLASTGNSPDVLINVTNDSWFRGSSLLDYHLACSILCAVENRRPLLVAANTGLSAHVDGAGRLLQQSRRLEAKVLWVEPQADSRWGLVQAVGYPFSWVASAIALLAWLSCIRQRRG